MKAKIWRIRCVVLCIAAVGLGTPGLADNLYWDANGADSGTGGTGAWNLTDQTWRLGSASGTLQAWANGTTGNAAYLAGTVGTLTLGADVTVSLLSVSSGYVINGDGGGLYKLILDSTSKVGGDGGSYALMMNGGGVTINAPVLLTGAFNMDFRSTITFGGSISNAVGSSAGFLSNGGTVTLNAANPGFSGGWKGGTLVIGHDLALGTGSITPGSSVRAGNGDRTISNPVGGSGGNPFFMTTGGSNNLTLAGGAGTGFVGGNGATFTVGSPVLTLNRPLFSYPSGSNGKDFPGFTKNGTGTLVLNESAAPTIGLTSGVNINAGKLVVNGGSQAATSVSASVTAGSAQFTLTSGTTANLRVGQNVQAVGTFPTGTVIVSIDSETQFTVADPWGSDRSGSWSISTAGGLGSQSGHINVNADATLGGNGTIFMGTGRTNTVLTGGTIAPGSITAGAEVGTLTFTNNAVFDFKADAIYEWQYQDGVGDKVQVYGTLILPTVATVNVSQVSGELPATATLFSATTLAGETDLSGWVVNGLPQYEARIEGTDVFLYLPPPPGTLLMLR